MKKVEFKINAIPRQVVVDEDMVLLDLLRNDFRLTGAKQSCDRKGQCGACTVIVNKKAVRSCLTKVAGLGGADIITIEGLGTPDNPHLIQEAFVLANAIQCGFCTPGMIMAAKALLDQNANPSANDIKKALNRNLCRCTGYKSIIEAVTLAGRFLRGEITPEQVRPNPNAGILGVPHPRPSAMIKACGVLDFGEDVVLHNAAEVAVVRSTEHHALIKSIDISALKKMPGVIGVMTAKDIRGTNVINDVFPDVPVLCGDKVWCLGAPIAIVVAETTELALKAASAVKVKYDPLPVYLAPSKAMAEGAVQVHPRGPNLCNEQSQFRGDAKKALAEAAAVVEAEFSTQLNHQAPLEREVCIAYLEGDDENAQLVISGRSIMIHRHANNLKEALGWENLRYEEANSGGQFGIKAHITSEAVAGAAAIHFKRPIRYNPSLAESLLMTSKRHPYSMKIKLAADAKGKLTAITNDFIVDNGAYTLLGQTVIRRSLSMLSGEYRIPNVQALGQLCYTNNPAGGAARGAGPPQTMFALESAIDMLAEKLGMDPLEFRLMNSLKPGQPKSTGAIVKIWPFPEVCEAIRPHYERARKEAASLKTGPVKRGVGLGCAAFGIGKPGDVCRAAVEVDPDNGITIYASVADPGEGNDAMLTQIAAEMLKIPMEKVRLVTRDSERTADSGSAASSRMTYVAGGALANACEQIKQAMKEAGTKTYEGLKKAGKPVRYMGMRQIPDLEALNPIPGQGGSPESEVHCIQMAEVEVNTETGDVKIIKITTAVDAGTVINPQTFAGQLEGGMDMGAGYALREEYIPGYTKDWKTFKFPTMKTAFDMEVITRETPREMGPLGATGVGEMTMLPTAPAVTNAIKDACGVRIYHLPATPEKIKAALAAGK